VRKFLALIVTPLVILAGCGGSGTKGGTSPPPPPPPPTQVIATPGPPNVEKLVVDNGPMGLDTPAVNTAFVTVTVCVPNTNNCQNIDHIEVDNGSVGLRIVSGATTVDAMGNVIPGTPFNLVNLALPAVPDPNNGNNVLAECLQFADGFSWGSVNTADIKLPVSGETATGVIVHVIGAPSAGDPSKATPTCLAPPPINADLCKGLENTVSCFGANGILGVGPFKLDCQSTSDCVPVSPICSGGNPCYPYYATTYFSCTTAATPSCAQATVHVAQQLPNPVARFATDNNGVIVELPAVGANGAAAPWNGSLVFGIGTQGNNALGSATKLPADPSSGAISATLNGNTYSFSYLDSGSNANFFPTTSIPSCVGGNAGFLCPQPPGTTVNESATLQGTNGMTLAADFTIADADTLFMGSNAAFSNLAGSNYDSTPGAANNTLDLGLAFFYGRNVFMGIENPNVSAPYYAY